MANREFIEKKTVSVSDRRGKTYNITLEAYFRNGRILCINVDDYILAMEFYKNPETGYYQNNPDSGWMFELPEEWPRRMGIGSSIWREVELLFNRCAVARVYGVIGEVIGYAQSVGWEDPQYEEHIKSLEQFWSKMGFTISSNHWIQKDYPVNKNELTL